MKTYQYNNQEILQTTVTTFVTEDLHTFETLDKAQKHVNFVNADKIAKLMYHISLAISQTNEMLEQSNLNLENYPQNWE